MRVAPDPAPLWLPADEATTDRKVSGAPPDRVEGWSWFDLGLTAIVGPKQKLINRLGLVVALFAWLVYWPTLAAGNTFEMVQVGVWQTIAIALLILATREVRSMSLGASAVFWLAGFFVCSLGVWVADLGLERLPGLSDAGLNAVRSLVAALVLVAVTLAGSGAARRRWEYPGLSDLLVAGYCVGAGYAAHVDGLWDRSDALGLLTGTEATWTALLVLAVGVYVFYPSGDLALLAAPPLIIVVLADVIVLNLWWLPTSLLVACLALAIFFDRRRLDQISERDHLFPEEHTRHGDLLVGRYRRLRIGMHNTLATRKNHWPPAKDAPVAELAQFAHVAGVEIGRGTSRQGWQPNPDDPSGSSDRFFSDEGWTTYVASDQGLRREPSRGRPDATMGEPPSPTEPWQVEAPGLVLVGLAIGMTGLVFLTVASATVDAITLGGAPTDPALFRTVAGALGAGAALIRSGRSAIAKSWELGPPGPSGA